MATFISFNYTHDGVEGHMESKILNGIAYDRIAAYAHKLLQMKKPGAVISGSIHFNNNGYSGNVAAL